MLPNPLQSAESFEQRLKAHPELRAKFEVLLSVVENAQGDLIRAGVIKSEIFSKISP
jgi:hypothetical protein